MPLIGGLPIIVSLTLHGIRLPLGSASSYTITFGYLLPAAGQIRIPLPLETFAAEDTKKRITFL